MADTAISFLGLAVLLGLAFLFSKNRRAVNWRTVAWGVTLQLILANIVLREGTPSFVGMLLLAFLIIFYTAQQELGERFGKWPLAAAAAVGTPLLVFLAYHLAHGVASFLLLAAVLAVVIALRLKHAGVSRWGFASVVVLGLGELWARGVDGRAAFHSLSEGVAKFLALSDKGAEFLFANLAHRDLFFVSPEAGWPGFGFQFAFVVLPTIIFFSAFMAVMYYLGIVQVVIQAMARFMRWSMQTSGSETMSCSANVFVGQTEAPFLVRPFLKDMTMSELHAIMVGGFATIAGSVLAGYIGMGVHPGHLLAASVMSAPAALVMAKLLYPETEESITSGEVELPKIETADNVVEAAASGTTDGLKLALNVGAMLIAFISLIAFVDLVLGGLDSVIDGQWMHGTQLASGEFAGIFPGSMRTLFGTLLAPLAFVMGVPWVDAAAVGNLLGIKLSVNEFVAYGELGLHIAAGDLQPRSEIIATYALCGFANFSSIGIQIGGLSALVPELRPKLAKIGVRAMCGGALASFMTATIAGFLL